MTDYDPTDELDASLQAYGEGDWAAVVEDGEAEFQADMRHLWSLLDRLKAGMGALVATDPDAAAEVLRSWPEPVWTQPGEVAA